MCCYIFHHCINFFIFIKKVKATSRWSIFLYDFCICTFFLIVLSLKFADGSGTFKLLITIVNMLFISFIPCLNNICYASIFSWFFLISLISFNISFVFMFFSISFSFFSIALHFLFFPASQYLWNISKLLETLFLLRSLVVS